MPSIQVNTSPLVRNFATLLSNSSIQITTKLGTQTLLRAEFQPSLYPGSYDRQLEFLNELIDKTNPGALDFLKDVAKCCIDDQRKAIADLMRSGEPSVLRDGSNLR